jgi:hypothetical protein
MPAILRQLPIAEAPSALVVGPGDVIAVHSYQVIVWVSVTARKANTLPPGAPRFPAILDPGHSHNFSIQDHHLQRWGRIAASSLRLIRQTRINRVTVPLLAAHVWIHPNRPGQRDRFTDAPPFRLDLARGIAVYPLDTAGGPRLPLLGLRALVENDLHLTIDGKNRRVALRTARRFWPF